MWFLNQIKKAKNMDYLMSTNFFWEKYYLSYFYKLINVFSIILFAVAQKRHICITEVINP